MFDQAFLEEDIFSASRSSMSRHPLNGTFSMDGVTYFSGLTGNTAVAGISSASGWAEYNISGQGFTRLSGVFGQAGRDRGRVILTVTGDGALLGSVTLNAGDSAKQNVNIAIPPGVQRIRITLQAIPTASGTIVAAGFGNAYFSR
jgi:hypothetical protein